MASRGKSESDGSEIWALRRGSNDPMIWPFRTERDAEDFKAEHSLIDYNAVLVNDPDRDHEPVCANCRERWPCRHVRIEGEAQRIMAAAANRCARCGKQIGWLKVTLTAAGELGEDIHYHGKLGACFNEAVRRARERDDEKALQTIERIERGRQQAREWKAQRVASL